MRKYFEEKAGVPIKKILTKACMLLVLAIALIGFIPTAYAAAFTDVPEDYWAASAIQYVTDRKLFNGISTTKFEPLENMSRAMLSTVLYRYAGSPEISGSAPYQDVPEGQWYTDGVTWAYENSIFPASELNSPLLEPETDVRRTEFCVTLYNFAAILGKSVPDNSAPIENSTFFDMNPLGSITRAEAAAMLFQFDINVLGGTEAPSEPELPLSLEPEPVPQLIPAQLIMQNPELPNGCEAVSLTMLLSCTGVQANKMDVYINYLPKVPFTWQNGVRFGPDPQMAYAGDASLKSGGWYCFENPIIAAGNAWLETNAPLWKMENCSGLDQAKLEEYLARGVPMVVWATLKCQTPEIGQVPWILPNMSNYYPYTNLHCFILTGISDGKYVAVDPIYGWQYLNPGTFWNVFNAMGRRAVTLAPAAGNLSPY